MGCPKLNSTQLYPHCSPAPWRVSPPLAGSGCPALFGLNYFFELWSHYFWTVIWSGRLSFHGFLLFPFLFTLLDVLPKASFYSSFWVVFITFMHLNLSREKLQNHCHLPLGFLLARLLWELLSLKGLGNPASSAAQDPAHRTAFPSLT